MAFCTMRALQSMRKIAIILLLAALVSGCGDSSSSGANHPSFSPYGGQLSKLKSSLQDPLVQFVGVVGVGDSIMWGRTLPGNAPVSPRTPRLDTPRDWSATPSFWNKFRAYVGETYMPGADPVVSNWQASPSGESTVTYTRTIQVFPEGGAFQVNSTGSGHSVSVSDRDDSVTGKTYTLTDLSGEGSGPQSIRFKFTGEQFSVLYRRASAIAFNNYDLLVDGRLIGTFSTRATGRAAPGTVARRTHAFDYVRDKEVEIRTNSKGLAGRRSLEIDGLEIPKTVRFTNQGVIGQTARTYNLYNLSGRYGPSAITERDQFIIAQFGTNDRGEKAASPDGSRFHASLQSLVDELKPRGNVILMSAGPVLEGSKADAMAVMTMKVVRGMVDQVAKANQVDFIDNLSPFDEVETASVIDGFAHPNEAGHSIMAKNIIDAIESI
ncbi:hypothetical protein FW789_04230 [Pseudomonas sp. 1121_17]